MACVARRLNLRQFGNAVQIGGLRAPLVRGTRCPSTPRLEVSAGSVTQKSAGCARPIRAAVLTRITRISTDVWFCAGGDRENQKSMEICGSLCAGADALPSGMGYRPGIMAGMGVADSVLTYIGLMGRASPYGPIDAA